MQTAGTRTVRHAGKLFATVVAGALILTSVSTVLAANALVGTFNLTAGADPPGTVGSYFRMILAGGSANGAFIANSSSTASNQTYTYLSPGIDGGLITGSYQPEPSPAFDGGGNSLAARIIDPTGFFGKNFSAATASVDPQTAIAVAAPSIVDDGLGNLSGDLRAWGAAWNNQEFNQGSPKPDGSQPGITTGPTGTYNSGTGAFTLDWISLIVGGPFNGFSGKWHLEGTFLPHIPISGKSLSLGDGADPSKRKLSVQASDLAIGLGAGNGSADDPTLNGATVRVLSATFDNTYALPAAQWAYLGAPGGNKGYRYKDKTGTFRGAQLKPGKPGKPGALKVSAKGSGLGHSLATNPEAVSVYVKVGGQRFFARFGGTTQFKAGKSFKAKSAPLP